MASPNDSQPGKRQTSGDEESQPVPTTPQSALSSPASSHSLQPDHHYVQSKKAYLVMAYLTLVTFMSSVSTGLLTTSVPTMAVELGIPPQTIYWPLSVYSLTAGASLIVAGTVADIVGSKRVFITGVFAFAAFTLGCGLAQSPIQLTMFRAMQGIAVAMCLPSSVGIICQSIVPGRLRNLAMACTGLGQPMGFSFGLVLGGIFCNTVGWRIGWYFAAATMFVCFPIGLFLLPADILMARSSLQRLRTQIDWLGAAIASACLAMLAYVLEQLSEDREVIHTPTVMTLLVISLVLMPCFVGWMHAAVKRGRPALIPNPIWKSLSFSSVCIMVMMSYAVLQVLELYSTLFYQKIQHLDPLQSSIRFLPSMLVGVALHFAVGLFVHRISAMWLVFGTSLACSGAPLLMATINPSWPYWYAAFPAQILHPLSADVLFCVGLITISHEFPDSTKSLAGAVFNTVAQFGASIGLAIVGIISDAATQASPYEDKSSPPALFDGYKAAFWASFGLTIATALIAVVGLRKLGSADTGKARSRRTAAGPVPPPTHDRPRREEYSGAST